MKSPGCFIATNLKGALTQETDDTKLAEQRTYPTLLYKAVQWKLSCFASKSAEAFFQLAAIQTVFRLSDNNNTGSSTESTELIMSKGKPGPPQTHRQFNCVCSNFHTGSTQTIHCIRNMRVQLVTFSKMETLVKLAECLNQLGILKLRHFQGVSIIYINRFCAMFYAPLMINSQHRHSVLLFIYFNSLSMTF